MKFKCFVCKKRKFFKRSTFWLRNIDNPEYFNPYCKKCYKKEKLKRGDKTIKLYVGCYYCKFPFQASFHNIFIREFGKSGFFILLCKECGISMKNLIDNEK